MELMSDDSATGTSNDAIPWLPIILVTVIFVLATSLWDASLTEEARAGNLGRFESVGMGSQLRRVLFSILGLYGLGSLIRPGRLRPTVSGLLGWSIVFAVAWSFLSVLWTADFGLTARRLVSFAAFCLGSLALARQLSPRNVGVMVFFSSSVFLVLSVLAELDHGTFTPFASGYRFTGVQHPNSQGMNCSLMVLSGMFLGESAKSNRRLIYFGTAVAFVFLILTKSRTSFASMVLAFLAYKRLVPKASKKKLVIFAIVLALLFVFLALSESGIPILGKGASLGRGGGDIDTLNGRIWLWMECRGYIGQRPIAGYGFNGFWSPGRMTAVSEAQGWDLGSAHSMYVDLALNLGMVGFIAFVIVIATAIIRSRWAFRETRDPGYAFLYSFIVFYALHGFLESIFVRPGYFAFVSMVVLASVSFSSEEVKSLPVDS